jgi:hypothetical protein
MPNNPNWQMEQTRFMNCATRTARCQATEVTMDTTDFEVCSTYAHESTTAYIPIDVVIQMMEHAGYTVSRTVCPVCGNGAAQHGVGCSEGPE